MVIVITHAKKMFCFIWIILIFSLLVNAQPLSCKEDVHCSEGYYCDLRLNLCYECLRCQDVKRNPPAATPFNNICIKSINSCGPCINGFLNIYKNGVKGKCVVPEFFEVGSKSDFAYMWAAAAVVGVLIVITFMYLIRHTKVFLIVAYYNPVSSQTSSEISSASAVTSPRKLLIYLIHFQNKTPEQQ